MGFLTGTGVSFSVNAQTSSPMNLDNVQNADNENKPDNENNAMNTDARNAIGRNVVRRGEYGNSKAIFETTRQGNVAFLGGSITEMNGYRPMVCEYLQTKFPQTDFHFIAAGISSTCSITGAFRLETDVLEKVRHPGEKIDLFFVEFAVNDDQDAGYSQEQSIRGMEGIIRHLRLSNPNADIVMTFFVNENLMDKYRQNEEAISIQAHQKVARQYEISTINLAKEITTQIDDQQLTWNEFGGVHPAPKGNRICANMIEFLLNQAWSEQNSAGQNIAEPKAAEQESAKQSVAEQKTEMSNIPKLQAHPLPECLDKYSYFNGTYLPLKDVQKDSGWTLSVPNWNSIPGSFRATFAGRECLCSSAPGSVCSFSFEGNAVGFFILAGPDAGMIEYKIDGQKTKSLDLYHPYSAGLHYPRTVMLADGLADKTESGYNSGKHQIEIKVLPTKNAKSSGNAVRILAVSVNKNSVQ